MVLPIYNVEEYLAECLDSLQAQTFPRFEVIVVDDGSPDSSRAIAERYAAADRRIRIVTRENGGLGAARNTGIKKARGRFLTFVDSDDLLPESALEVLVGSAQATGADIVAGGVQRFDPHRSWRPDWVREVHLYRHENVKIEEFLPLLRNLYTWNKLFRRDFWDKQGLWFREGVAYEDQPIITQLLARASGIDVLTDVVYSYRMRDDASSISQQTATLKDLRDRLSAWQETSDALLRDHSKTLYDAWLLTLFRAHFHWYLNSPGTADETYWRELQAAVAKLADNASPQVWQATAPAKRVLIELTRQGRHSDVLSFVGLDARRTERWQASATQDGVLLKLPFFGDPALPDELFLLRPEQLELAHSVESFRWLAPDTEPGGECEIKGWAYLTKVDLAEHPATVTLLLRGSDAGVEREIPTSPADSMLFAPPVEDDWCDYRPGRFTARFDLGDVVASGKQQETWSLFLKVRSAGFTVVTPVTQVIRSGSAGVIAPRTLASGDLVVAEWRFSEPLRFRLVPTRLHLDDVRLKGRRLRGTVSGELASDIVRVQVSGGRRRADGSVKHTASGTRFDVEVPSPPDLRPGAQQRWNVQAETAGGDWHRLTVPSEPEQVMTGKRHVLALTRTLRGHLAIDESPLRVLAEQVRIGEDTVTVSGSVAGKNAVSVSLVTKGKKARAIGEQAPVVDGRFSAQLPLSHDAMRFGKQPLPYGEHDMSARVHGQDGDHVEVPLRIALELNNTLPVGIRTDLVEGRLVRGREGTLRVSLDRPVGVHRGRFQQHLLRSTTTVAEKATRGVMFRSYFGEQATDNGVSIQRELRRRGSDMPVYWAVQDLSVAVPEGGIPVVVHTPRWYELLFSVKYYVDNMYQPEYHQKPPGQIIVQTFHGYPFKQMGHPHWRNLGFSQVRIDSYDKRSRDWDYLVSPARYATPLLTRDFAYEGEVLEIGYPRNDALLAPDADQVRAVVRSELGISENQTAVLYAPTFRDYLAKRDNRARMADFLDFKAATDALGSDYVLLVRGHAFNARARQRVGTAGRVIDVTDYPEVADLYLASDAAVVDYSSLRFDYGVTGKPMIFHVPDIERYQNTRGWLFDFESSAPGPHVATTAEVVRHLVDLDGVRRSYAEAYDAFRENFLDLEDGHAGRRFVDAVFAPRGDV